MKDTEQRHGIKTCKMETSEFKTQGGTSLLKIQNKNITMQNTERKHYSLHNASYRNEALQ